jgi:hypothetical protein
LMHQCMSEHHHWLWVIVAVNPAMSQCWSCQENVVRKGSSSSSMALRYFVQ